MVERIRGDERRSGGRQGGKKRRRLHKEEIAGRKELKGGRGHCQISPSGDLEEELRTRDMAVSHPLQDIELFRRLA